MCPCGYYSSCWRSCTPEYIEAVKQIYDEDEELQRLEIEKDAKEEKEGTFR